MDNEKVKTSENIVAEAQKIADNAQFCLSCPKKLNCRKICPELEKVLPKPRGGGHKKEGTLSSDILDHYPQEAKLPYYRKYLYGKQKHSEGNHPITRKPDLGD